MQLINSTVIRELSTRFFSGSLYPGAYIWGWGGGGYIRVLISGRLVSWGLISEGLIYPGAYIRSIYPGGLKARAYVRGTFIRGLISGSIIRGAYNRGANIWGLITGGLCPELISGGFLSRGLILHTDNFLRLNLFYARGAGACFCCN